jgi:site-specific DNA-methyltransferase (adenine-specific)
MSEVKDESVHCVITSPPYVTTKMEEEQDFNYKVYRAMIEDVFKEVYRVLIPDGRFCLNVADIRTKYFYDDGGLYRIPVANDLLMMCHDLGFRMIDTIIWDKGFNRNFGGPLLGSYPYPATLYHNAYFEYIYILKKPGKRPPLPPKIKERSKLDKRTWQEYVQKIWRIETETEWFQGHEAVFPLEIPLRLIRMYSFVEDTILDPFLGSGTTTLAARLLGRNSIGYEINESLVPIIKERVRINELTLFEGLQNEQDIIEIKEAKYRVRERME